ncbi:Antirestriction protein [Shigella sonnei]|nr:Antirestriction protein [Shigella sonnei]
MSVVAPAVYVGTWHKYNCGSIAGRWFDLTTFDDERDFFAACRAGSALPGHAGHGLVGFQLCGRRVVCGLCRASIVAGLLRAGCKVR